MSAHETFERQLLQAVALNAPAVDDAREADAAAIAGAGVVADAAVGGVSHHGSVISGSTSAGVVGDAAVGGVSHHTPRLGRREVPGPGLPRRPRSPRRLARVLVAASLVVVVGAVGVATLTGSGSTGGLLSPEEAVAAAQADLGTATGVLHWRARETADGGGSGLVVDRWIDLRTGANSTERAISPRYRPELRGVRARVVDWQDAAGNSWQQQPLDQNPRGPIVVRDHPAPTGQTSRSDQSGKSGQSGGSGQTGESSGSTRRIPTPADEIREALAAAAAGTATVEPAPSQDGVAVVKISQGLRKTLWITREAEPRVLRLDRASWSCDPGVDCSKPSNDLTRSSIVTERWDVLPATAETLAEVRPPVFGTGRYELVADPQFDAIQKRLSP